MAVKKKAPTFAKLSSSAEGVEYAIGDMGEYHYYAVHKIEDGDGEDDATEAVAHIVSKIDEEINALKKYVPKHIQNLRDVKRAILRKNNLRQKVK